jgi:hypothetical protein
MRATRRFKQSTLWGWQRDRLGWTRRPQRTQQTKTNTQIKPLVDASAAGALSSQPSSERQLNVHAVVAHAQALSNAITSTGNASLHVNNLSKGKLQARHIQRRALRAFQVERNATQVLVVDPALELGTNAVASDGVSPAIAAHTLELNVSHASALLSGQLDSTTSSTLKEEKRNQKDK